MLRTSSWQTILLALTIGIAFPGDAYMMLETRKIPHLIEYSREVIKDPYSRKRKILYPYSEKYRVFRKQTTSNKNGKSTLGTILTDLATNDNNDCKTKKGIERDKKIRKNCIDKCKARCSPDARCKVFALLREGFYGDQQDCTYFGPGMSSQLYKLTADPQGATSEGDYNLHVKDAITPNDDSTKVHTWLDYFYNELEATGLKKVSKVGYCRAQVSWWSGVTNTQLCTNGVNGNIMYHFSATIFLPAAGTWRFHWAADVSGGGFVLWNGEAISPQTGGNGNNLGTDMTGFKKSETFNSHNGAILEWSKTVPAGANHSIDIFGFGGAKFVLLKNGQCFIVNSPALTDPIFTDNRDIRSLQDCKALADSTADTKAFEWINKDSTYYDPRAYNCRLFSRDVKVGGERYGHKCYKLKNDIDGLQEGMQEIQLIPPDSVSRNEKTGDFIFGKEKNEWLGWTTLTSQTKHRGVVVSLPTPQIKSHIINDNNPIPTTGGNEITINGLFFGFERSKMQSRARLGDNLMCKNKNKKSLFSEKLTIEQCTNACTLSPKCTYINFNFKDDTCVGLSSSCDIVRDIDDSIVNGDQWTMYEHTARKSERAFRFYNQGNSCKTALFNVVAQALVDCYTSCVSKTKCEYFFYSGTACFGCEDVPNVTTITETGFVAYRKVPNNFKIPVNIANTDCDHKNFLIRAVTSFSSRHDCENSCLAESNNACTGITYNPETKECYLRSKNYHCRIPADSADCSGTDCYSKRVQNSIGGLVLFYNVDDPTDVVECRHYRVWNSGQVICTIPPGDGTRTIVVKPSTIGPVGQDTTINGRPTFKYSKPKIDRVDPPQLPTNGINPITIFGKNFGVLVKNKTVVKLCDTFSLVACNTLTLDKDASSHTQLVVQGEVGYGEKSILVDVAGRKDDHKIQYKGPFVDLKSFSGKAPTEGGASITIKGSNFGAYGVAIVKLGETRVNCTSNDMHNELVCNTTVGKGKNRLTVRVGDFKAENDLEYDYDAPKITEMNWPSADRLAVNTDSGVLVTLKGSNFGISKYNNDLQVKVGNVLVTNAYIVNHTDVRFVMPPSTGASSCVTVKLAKLPQITATCAYIQRNAPVVTSLIMPSLGLETTGKEYITMTGYNFGTDITKVRFDFHYFKTGSKTMLTIKSVSDTQAVALSPIGEGAFTITANVDYLSFPACNKFTSSMNVGAAKQEKDRIFKFDNVLGVEQCQYACSQRVACVAFTFNELVPGCSLYSSRDSSSSNFTNFYEKDSDCSDRYQYCSGNTLQVWPAEVVNVRYFGPSGAELFTGETNAQGILTKEELLRAAYVTVGAGPTMLQKVRVGSHTVFERKPYVLNEKTLVTCMDKGRDILTNSVQCQEAARELGIGEMSISSPANSTLKGCSYNRFSDRLYWQPDEPNGELDNQSSTICFASVCMVGKFTPATGDEGDVCITTASETNKVSKTCPMGCWPSRQTAPAPHCYTLGTNENCNVDDRADKVTRELPCHHSVPSGCNVFTSLNDTAREACLDLTVFKYNKPTISKVYGADGASTSGRDEIQIYGDNFGTEGSVRIVDHLDGYELCLVKTWTHQYITCILPAGKESNIIYVVAGAQKSSNGWVFSYSGPSITLGDRTGPTDGETTLVISGNNLGPPSPNNQVWLGPKTANINDCQSVPDLCFPAKIIGWGDSDINFRVPGQGKDLSIFLQSTTGHAQSTLLFSYDPPVITDVSPGRIYSKNVFKITITGRNFGMDHSLISVNIEGLKDFYDGEQIVTMPAGSLTELVIDHQKIAFNLPATARSMAPDVYKLRLTVAGVSAVSKTGKPKASPPRITSMTSSNCDSSTSDENMQSTFLGPHLKNCTTSKPFAITVTGTNFGFKYPLCNASTTALECATNKACQWKEEFGIAKCEAKNDCGDIADEASCNSKDHCNYEKSTSKCRLALKEWLQCEYRNARGQWENTVGTGGAQTVKDQSLLSTFVCKFTINTAGGNNLLVRVRTRESSSTSEAYLDFKGPMIVAPLTPLIHGDTVKLEAGEICDQNGTPKPSIFVKFDLPGILFDDMRYECNVIETKTKCGDNGSGTIKCRLPDKGVGAGLVFKVKTGMLVSPESATTAYFEPMHVEENSIRTEGESLSFESIVLSQQNDVIQFNLSKAAYLLEFPELLTVVYREYVESYIPGSNANCTDDGLLSKNGQYCCPKNTNGLGCNECGGPNCAEQPGGENNCCAATIASQKKKCSNTTEPCIMPYEFECTNLKVSKVDLYVMVTCTTAAANVDTELKFVIYAQALNAESITNINPAPNPFIRYPQGVELISITSAFLSDGAIDPEINQKLVFTGRSCPSGYAEITEPADCKTAADLLDTGSGNYSYRADKNKNVGKKKSVCTITYSTITDPIIYITDFYSKATDVVCENTGCRSQESDATHAIPYVSDCRTQGGSTITISGRHFSGLTGILIGGTLVTNYDPSLEEIALITKDDIVKFKVVTPPGVGLDQSIVVLRQVSVSTPKNVVSYSLPVVRGVTSGNFGERPGRIGSSCELTPFINELDQCSENCLNNDTCLGFNFGNKGCFTCNSIENIMITRESWRNMWYPKRQAPCGKVVKQGEVVNCPRQGGSTLTITGSGFGEGTPIVLIGKELCKDVFVIRKHTLLECVLDIGTSLDLAILVIQDGGSLTMTTNAIVSYEKCDVGSYGLSNGTTGCVNCERGYFANVAGLLDRCLECPSGKFSQGGAETCEACTAGTYSNKQASHECLNCTQSKGEYGDASGLMECKLCGPGSYSAMNASEKCTLCEKGKAIYGKANSECEPCNSPYVAEQRGVSRCYSCQGGRESSNNATVCQQCAEGRYSPNGDYCMECLSGTKQGAVGQETCPDCLKGRYQNDTGKSACKRCDAGKVSTEEGESACESCAAGRYELNRIECKQCAAGTQAPEEGSISCVACNAGRSTAGNGESCVDCTTGKSAAGKGATTCKICKQGKFANDTASTECTLCPAGKSQSSSEASACVSCAEGRYSVRDGSISCKGCPQGRAHNDLGRKECDICSAGSYSQYTSPGPTSCTTCEVGKFQPGRGEALCKFCGQGKHSVKGEGNRTECTKCDKGKYSDKDGLEECQECAAGFYADAFGTVRCTQCKQGTATSEMGSHNCPKCSPGEDQDKQGQTTCNACNPGFYGKTAGLKQCHECLSGTYQPELNEKECRLASKGYHVPSNKASEQTPCSSGFDQQSIGASQCNECLPGTFAKENGTETCDSCQPGRMGPENRLTECILCSAGKFASGGNKQCRDCPPGQVAPTVQMAACTACTNDAVANQAKTICLCDVGFAGECKLEHMSVTNGSCTKTTCLECPRGAQCDVKGLVYKDLRPIPGWFVPEDWHSSGLSFEQCLLNNHCFDKDRVNGGCSPNRDPNVALCAVCKANHTESLGGECERCSASKGRSYAIFFSVAIIALLLLGLLYFILVRNAKVMFVASRIEILQRQRESLGFVLSKDERLDWRSYMRHNQILTINGAPPPKPSFLFKFKIALGFIQVCTNLMIGMQIAWPWTFKDFLSTFNILNLDFFAGAAVGCVIETSYFLEMWIMCLIPVALIVLLVAVYALPSYCCNKNQDSKKDTSVDNQVMMQKFWSMVMFTLFLLYPTVSTVIMRLYQCKDVYGSLYLRHDFSILCNEDSGWATHAKLGTLLIFAYPIGVPLFMFSRLFHYRYRLRELGVRAAYGFVFDAYERKLYFWELCDMAFKLTISALVPFIPETKHHVPAAMVVAVLYLVSILWCKPFLRRSDDSLQQVAITEIILLLMGAYWAQENWEEAEEKDEIYSVMLIFFCLSFAVYLTVSVSRSLQKVLLGGAIERCCKKGEFGKRIGTKFFDFMTRSGSRGKAERKLALLGDGFFSGIDVAFESTAQPSFNFEKKRKKSGVSAPVHLARNSMFNLNVSFRDSNTELGSGLELGSAVYTGGEQGMMSNPMQAMDDDELDQVDEEVDEVDEVDEVVDMKIPSQAGQ